jgi:hypothetical protein
MPLSVWNLDFTSLQWISASDRVSYASSDMILFNTSISYRFSKHHTRSSKSGYICSLICEQNKGENEGYSVKILVIDG